MSGWSGVVDPGWGGFHAVTKTPNVGAIGMLVEPSAYLKPEFVAAWRDAKEVDTGLIAYVWRSKEAGLDYPVYFAGGIPIQKTEISGMMSRLWQKTRSSVGGGGASLWHSPYQ